MAKTFPALLIGMEGWYSTRCRLTWKLKGTKYNRTYFQLAVSTLPTEEIGSGLLPTATAQDYKRRGPNIQQQGLPEAAYNGLLPTPTVMDTNCGDLQKIDQRRERAKQTSKNGNGFGMTVGELANRGLLPTPCASDIPEKNTGKRSQASIPKMIPDAGGQTSQLNPQFVAEMMGFPNNWTELPFLSGETKV